MTARVANRLDGALERLRAQGSVGVIPYVTVGYPERDSTLDLVPALEREGVAAVELGIPFSDPLADGATIQRASARALQNGVTVAFCLETAAALRARGVKAPLVLMGYVNPLLQFGVARFCAEAARAGVDGLIVPDLPPEEASELEGPCRDAGLHLVFLAAPTSDDQRLRAIARHASGFIYCVSLLGVTGARSALPADLPAFLGRVRAHTRLPLAVGFGISRPDQVAALRGQAEGAIVGSALLDEIERAPGAERPLRAGRFIATLVKGGRDDGK